jgi:hypothetical protein
MIPPTHHVAAKCFGFLSRKITGGALFCVYMDTKRSHGASRPKVLRFGSQQVTPDRVASQCRNAIQKHHAEILPG